MCYFGSFLCFDEFIVLMGMSLVIRVECTSRLSVPEWYPLALIFSGILISKVTVKCIASSFIIDNRDLGLW